MDSAVRSTSGWEPSFEEIFDLSLDLLCVGSLDGYFTRVNPALEHAFGCSSQELMSRPLLDFVDPQDRASTLDAVEQLARGEAVTGLETRILCADGSTLWLEWSAKPVPAKRIFFGTGRDVTDRKCAEERLREARQIVETSRDELRVHLEEQASLQRVATLVARGGPPGEIFNAVAAEVARLFRADLAILVRYEVDDAATVLASGGRIAPDMPVGTRATLDGESVAASVLRTGRPVAIERYSDAQGPWAARLRGLGIQSAVGAPIVVEGRIWGGIAAAFTQYKPLVADDVESRIASFAELVGTAIANAESRAELTASRARVVAAADATRQRIERDLHDGAQQQLVSLALEVRAAQATVPHELGALRAELAGVAERLTSVLDELREIAHGIHPALLAQGGLEAALKTLARRSAVPVKLRVQAPARLPEPVEVAAYYVVSEALANAAKHAQASIVDVEVEALDGLLRVSVRDDGVGGADPRRGSGLLGLKDRAEAIGGTISLESHRGAGTVLHVDLPLADRAS